MTIHFKQLTQKGSFVKEFHFSSVAQPKQWISSKTLALWNLDELNNNLLRIYNHNFELVLTVNLYEINHKDRLYINFISFVITELTPYIVLSHDKKHAVQPERIVELNGQILLINTMIPLDNFTEFSETQATFYEPKTIDNVYFDPNLTAELLLNKMNVD